MRRWHISPRKRNSLTVFWKRTERFTGKQRHTAKRIIERFLDEHRFAGGQTIVKDYVRERRRHLLEMFVPLAHPPGDAQADFGEANAIIAGVKRRAHFFAIDPPHTNTCFVVA